MALLKSWKNSVRSFALDPLAFSDRKGKYPSGDGGCTLKPNLVSSAKNSPHWA